MRNWNLTPSTTRHSWRLVALALAALLVLAPAAQAQAQEPAAPIEQQMTAEQFKAAGLDRLDPEQLANLNQWLNRTIEAEAGKAVETAKQDARNESRGFLDFGSKEPIKTRISGEFRGFAKGRSYTLENGQVWQQMDNATLAGVRKDQPGVTISPSVIGNLWFLAVDGYNARAKVQRIK